MVERVGFSPTHRSPLIYLIKNKFAASVTLQHDTTKILLALIELPLQRYSRDIYNHNLFELKMVHQTGFEPMTLCLEGRCSILLSYWCTLSDSNGDFIVCSRFVKNNTSKPIIPFAFNQSATKCLWQKSIGFS